VCVGVGLEFRWGHEGDHIAEIVSVGLSHCGILARARAANAFGVSRYDSLHRYCISHLGVFGNVGVSWGFGLGCGGFFTCAVAHAQSYLPTEFGKIAAVEMSE
jgi:hypothetical protein